MKKQAKIKPPMAKQAPKPTSAVRGRKSKAKSINIEQLRFLIEKGCTDDEICRFFKLSRTSFWRYQQINEDFRNAIKSWKVYADDAVERSLYQKAMGYSHGSEEIFCAFGKVTRVKTIKQYPPDTLAAIIWLKNRRPEVWRENPPPALDSRFADAELEFVGVPNQRDPKLEKEFAKFYEQN